eukprot:Plantae.Rhodophyta-Purpureofilum_apyrenoidigerum.ctg2531.p1 GENE.Plantae.Rhodophyta-Purpureofilum_apyrenoidigerum.ctg2531~~Plantae.Rhodophyta-Purpureofilum_apyrenoidigerum.ctg2531.p1  ORF type:complete len:215 (-),score=31.00 Plantae.Rhodophyta-Purpureofilum_apyrenoidigerum.ctg2531:159-803(-)
MNAFVGGFVPARAGSLMGVRVSHSAPRSVARFSMMAKSKSVPFMENPPALDGSMAGDVGFDPLNISGYLNIKWLREAELKHCRICMLAALGWLVQEFYTFPFYAGAPKLPTAAHDYFSKTALSQVALFVATWEILTTPAVIQMLSGESDRMPGDFGFDPLGLTGNFNPDKVKRFQFIEVINGRLAMIAIGGMVHQAWITKMGAIEQIQAGRITP